MEDLEKLAGPLILAPLMFVVGLQLTVADFRRVLAQPRSVLGGTLGQLILLPLMTLAVIHLFTVSPWLAAGALLVSATPGAGMSNIMAAVSGANVALSVTLTAFTSVLSILTIPLSLALASALFLGDTLNVDVPLRGITLQLLLFLAVPISLGMYVRARHPETALRYVSRANRFALIAIVVLTVLGALTSDIEIPQGVDVGWAVATAAVWTLCAMAIGYGLASALHLPNNDRFTYLIEFGARNMALAVVVAVTSVEGVELVLFPLIYGIVGTPLVLLLAIVRGRRQREKHQIDYPSQESKESQNN